MLSASASTEVHVSLGAVSFILTSPDAAGVAGAALPIEIAQ